MITELSVLFESLDNCVYFAVKVLSKITRYVYMKIVL